MPFERVKYGTIRPALRYTESWLKSPCLWLSQELGFYPLFLAVGFKDWQLRMTGYQDQFRRWIGTNAQRQRLYRKKGEFPNYVLFSFDETDIVDGVFLDECAWSVFILNPFLAKRPEAIKKTDLKMVFKRSLGKADWLRIATTGKYRGYTTGVNLIVPALDLIKAKRVWARNQETGQALVSMGFRNVAVKRLNLPDL